MADLNSSKNIWVAIALALITSLTTLTNTFLSSDSGVGKEIEVIKKDLVKITESINVINKRSNLSYLGMDTDSLARSSYNLYVMSFMNRIQDICDQKIPFKVNKKIVNNLVDFDDFNIFIGEEACDMVKKSNLKENFNLSLVFLDPVVIESKEKD